MQSFADRASKVIADNAELFMLLEELDRTGKLRKLAYKKRENFTIDEDLMNDFRAYCKRSNIKMSNKVEDLIASFLKREKERG